MKKLGKNPWVSMIIATYNEEEHIADCINSLLNQDYPKLEIVVTDDGSDDKTVRIVEDIAKKKKNVKLIRQNHLGMAQAWNNSANHAKGKIFIMFGADTMAAEKSYVRKMVQPIIKEGYLGSCHTNEIIINRVNIWARARSALFERYGKDRLKRIGKHPDKIYHAVRADAWMKIGGADTRKGYDADQTFYSKLKVAPKQVDASMYHNHPASFSECWKQAVWIGRSMKRKDRIKIFLTLPIFPLYVVYKSFQFFIKDPYVHFIYFLPFYHAVRYFGYLTGCVNFMIFKRRYR